MPNWCNNDVTITASKEKIDALVDVLTNFQEETGVRELFAVIRPRPADQEDNWYEWNCSNWGTKWDASVYHWDQTDEQTIQVSFDTAWSPPLALYEYMVANGYSVSATYNEPGMCFAGIYEDGYDEYYEYADMSADQIEKELPSDLNEAYGISESISQWEEENSDETED